MAGSAILEAYGVDDDMLDTMARGVYRQLLRNEEYSKDPDVIYDRLMSAREVLSDYICKDIQRRIDCGGELSERDVLFMAGMAGRSPGGHGLDDEEDWEDGMLEEYAEHLRNYRYTYKPEATEVDPRIDPDEEHRGPMAQHIELVAPDCVNETEEGVKTVDGNRLALVNAGVIGALARRLLRLESAVGMNGGGYAR